MESTAKTAIQRLADLLEPGEQVRVITYRSYVRTHESSSRRVGNKRQISFSETYHRVPVVLTDRRAIQFGTGVKRGGARRHNGRTVALYQVDESQTVITRYAEVRGFTVDTYSITLERYLEEPIRFDLDAKADDAADTLEKAELLSRDHASGTIGVPPEDRARLEQIVTRFRNNTSGRLWATRLGALFGLLTTLAFGFGGLFIVASVLQLLHAMTRTYSYDLARAAFDVGAPAAVGVVLILGGVALAGVTFTRVVARRARLADEDRIRDELAAAFDSLTPATAPVAPAPAPAPTSGRFRLVSFEGSGNTLIALIKLVRRATGAGLAEAKGAVDRCKSGTPVELELKSGTLGPLIEQGAALGARIEPA